MSATMQSIPEAPDGPQPNIAANGAAKRDVKVRFDDSKMSSTYANVANVGMSQDEVSFLFGVNRTWGAVDDAVNIELSNRVIMTPAVARSFCETLQRVLAEYDRQMAAKSEG